MDIKEYISSGIIELYVMGLCSPEEEKELEALRPQYKELHEAILQYEKDMEEKMLRYATLPDAETDKQILQQLASLNTPVVQMRPVQSTGLKFNWIRSVAAAAVILLGISAYFNYTLYNKTKKQAALISNSTSSPLPAADYTVITNPAITPVALYGVGSHAICRCTMFWDKSTGKAYIMIHHLPRSSSSKDYQLWAEVDGKTVSVGIINDAIRGRFIEVTNVPNQSIAFKVTLEQSGGAAQPTLAETYLEGKI